MTRDRSHLRKLAAEGERYGKWTLVRYVGQTRRGQRWLCRCDCGTEQEQDLPQLKSNTRRGEGMHCMRCRVRDWQKRQVGTRAGLRGLAGRYGDREAFVRHELNEMEEFDGE